MAATRGVLVGGMKERDTNPRTILGARYVTSTLSTWDGKLESEVWADGRSVVRVNGVTVWQGNVNKEDN